MKIALLFGSFNPIHLGHLKMAEAAIAHGVDEVWFLPSPQNPLKDSKELIDIEERIAMVNMAISGSLIPTRHFKFYLNFILTNFLFFAEQMSCINFQPGKMYISFLKTIHFSFAKERLNRNGPRAFNLIKINSSSYPLNKTPFQQVTSA